MTRMVLWWALAKLAALLVVLCVLALAGCSAEVRPLSGGGWAISPPAVLWWLLCIWIAIGRGR